MRHIRPKIQGHEHKELIWAKDWPMATHCAVPVNADELCDSLVMRFKFTFWERLRVLFGQDLFLWFNANGQSPQWPSPYLTDPVWTRLTFESGAPDRNKVLPSNAPAWFQEAAKLVGYTTENPHSDQGMLAPNLETELRKTVREKINEAAAERAKELKDSCQFPETP